MIAAVAARAAALADIDPDLIPFTAVLSLVRSRVHAGDRCGQLPADPLGQLITDVTAYPGTAPDANGRQAGHQPNDAPGPPRKPITPSRSRRQISRNGSKRPEVTVRAMPEIITPGVSGALITRDDPHELAAAIAAALADDALYESCYERAPEMAEYFSWERTALDVADVITQALRPAP